MPLIFAYKSEKFLSGTGLLIQEEAWEDLRESIDNFDNFDQIGLANQLFKHECLEFRRISSYLYRKNGRYKESIELSKQDKLYRDAMDTAAQSREVALVDDLISFFVAEKENECFAACLFTCYDLVKPDVVLEMAWRQGLTDFAMPYIIQFVGEYSTRLGALEAAEAARQGSQQNQQMDVPSMEVPMALPQYAGQGAMGYQDPNVMAAHQAQQERMMQQQTGMMQPGMGQGGMYMQ